VLIEAQKKTNRQGAKCAKKIFCPAGLTAGQKARFNAARGEIMRHF
jgi:hypothetical protein